MKGLMISSLCSTEESVLQLTLASFYPILLMSGIIWPIEAQPLVLAQVSKFLPLTFATDALRCILEKGITFESSFFSRVPKFKLNLRLEFIRV
jgi:hypothetical protein